jgi:hypothetical protein
MFGFITHHELDHMLGGGAKGPRRRLRLQADGRLPMPYDLGRVNRVELKIFPTFVLVALLGDARRTGVIEGLEEGVRDAFEAESFVPLMGCLKEVVAERPGWNFERALVSLADLAPGPLEAWGEVISGAEYRLLRCGILIEHDLGEVENCRHGVYRLRVEEGHLELPPDRFAVPIDPGERAYLERFSLRGDSSCFAFPCLGESASAGQADEEDTDEHELVGWFRRAVEPSSRPLPAEPEDLSEIERVPLRRSSPRRQRHLRVTGTMTRVPRGG